MNPVEIKFENTEYVAYYFGKQVSKGKSLEKVVKKLHAYIKGQS